MAVSKSSSAAETPASRASARRSRALVEAALEEGDAEEAEDGVAGAGILLDDAEEGLLGLLDVAGAEEESGHAGAELVLLGGGDALDRLAHGVEGGGGVAGDGPLEALDGEGAGAGDVAEGGGEVPDVGGGMAAELLDDGADLVLAVGVERLEQVDPVEGGGDVLGRELADAAVELEGVGAAAVALEEERGVVGGEGELAPDLRGGEADERRGRWWGRRRGRGRRRQHRRRRARRGSVAARAVDLGGGGAEVDGAVGVVGAGPDVPEVRGVGRRRGAGGASSRLPSLEPFVQERNDADLGGVAQTDVSNT